MTFHCRFWILGIKSIKCFRNITTENWYINRLPDSVCNSSFNCTRRLKWLNIKAKWSESTDWSDFSPVTSKSFLVITRSSVFPAVCVGIFTCCDKLYWLSKALNLFAPESDWLFTWKLKSPTIKCFPVVVCRWHRRSLNSVWKAVVKFPEGLYTVIILKTSESEKRFTVWCSNDEYFWHWMYAFV